MHALIRQGNGKYYVSAVFGYYMDITTTNDYEKYLCQPCIRFVPCARFVLLATLAILFFASCGRQNSVDVPSLESDAETLLAQGCRYKKGQGVPRDIKLAEKYLRMAGQKGSGKAWCELGDLYDYASFDLDGIGEAIACYQKAVDLGSPEGYENLGGCYLFGWGVPFDADKGLELMRKGADAGSYVAMHYLGECYAYGKGVDLDRKEADKWYAKAVDIARTLAEQGDDIALTCLGDWYMSGNEGVPADEALSRSFYEKAYARGNLAATEYLAFSYMYDDTVPDWEAKTTALFKELSDMGYPFAAMELFKMNAGDALTCGKMTPKQQDEFDRLVKQLEERGSRKDPNAYLELGFIFGEYLINKDPKRAEAYYRKAADLGHPSAFYHLGKLCRDDNPKQAREYLEKAVAGGKLEALGELCIEDALCLALLNHIISSEHPEEEKKRIEMDSKKKDTPTAIKLTVALSLSLLDSIASATPEKNEKLETFLTNCARHLKRLEKCGANAPFPFHEDEDIDSPVDESLTVEGWLKRLKDAARTNQLVQRVMVLYGNLP